mgnify:CR=1 FL=1
MNGVNGYKVKSRTNGNSIFLPAAGYRNGTLLDYTDSCGGYWSATPGSISLHAYGFGFFVGDYYWRDDLRSLGQAVRPVSEK